MPANRLTQYRPTRSRQEMLACLAADPGTRTLGELIQERQWALDEIYRLQARITGKIESECLPDWRNAASSANPLDAPPPKPVELMRLADVRARLGLARSTIYRLMQLGKFPMPIKVGERAVRWRYVDLALWVQSRAG